MTISPERQPLNVFNRRCRPNHSYPFYHTSYPHVKLQTSIGSSVKGQHHSYFDESENYKVHSKLPLNHDDLHVSASLSQETMFSQTSSSSSSYGITSDITSVFRSDPISRDDNSDVYESTKWNELWTLKRANPVLDTDDGENDYVNYDRVHYSYDTDDDDDDAPREGHSPLKRARIIHPATVGDDDSDDEGYDLIDSDGELE
jgi:hypothetical protein